MAPYLLRFWMHTLLDTSWTYSQSIMFTLSRPMANGKGKFLDTVFIGSHIFKALKAELKTVLCLPDD